MNLINPESYPEIKLEMDLDHTNVLSTDKTHLVVLQQIIILKLKNLKNFLNQLLTWKIFVLRKVANVIWLIVHIVNTVRISEALPDFSPMNAHSTKSSTDFKTNINNNPKMDNFRHLHSNLGGIAN